MSDNVTTNEATSSGAKFACANLTVSGDDAYVQMVGCGILSGSEGSWTLSQIVGGAGEVEAGVQRVTLAWDDPAVTDLAALEVLATTIAGDTTSLDGKVTKCNTDAVVLSTGTNTIGGVIAAPSTSTAYDGTTSCTIKRAAGIATDSGANTLIAAVEGYQIRVLAMTLIATSATAVSLYIYNGDKMLLGDGTNKVTLDMDGGGGPAGLVLPWNPGGWLQTDADNEALAVNLSGATPVVWAITYVEVT